MRYTLLHHASQKRARNVCHKFLKEMSTMSQTELGFVKSTINVIKISTQTFLVTFTQIQVILPLPIFYQTLNKFNNCHISVYFSENLII